MNESMEAPGARLENVNAVPCWPRSTIPPLRSVRLAAYVIYKETDIPASCATIVHAEANASANGKLLYSLNQVSIRATIPDV